MMGRALSDRFNRTAEPLELDWTDGLLTDLIGAGDRFRTGPEQMNLARAYRDRLCGSDERHEFEAHRASANPG